MKKKYYCKEKDCHNKISYTTWKYGQGRCHSCENKRRHKSGILNIKDINNPNYKDGRSLKKNYCIGCGIELSDYRIKRCRKCDNKIASERESGKNNNSYIDGRTMIRYFCIDCLKKGIKTEITYPAKRCRECEVIRRIKCNIWKHKPNKPEKQLNKLLQKILPKEYKYVGDGKIYIVGFVPDFIDSNDQKKIIEMYGDYWHNREDTKKRDKLRLKTYKKYGYKTLIVWEKELQDLNKLKNRILKFNKN